MKKFLCLTVGVIMVTLSGFAQSAKYGPAMASNLKLMQAASSMQDYNSVAAAFDRIAKAEKTLWVPYYFSALAKLNGAMKDQSVDKDKIGAEVDSLLTSAEVIEKNSELSTLHYYNEILKMSVNPSQRYMEVAPLLEKYYNTAITQDSTNPRIYFMKGSTVFHTPESFGGGKAAAKPIFQKSVDLFSKQPQDTGTSFAPTWGKAEAEAMLKSCSE